MKKEKPEKKNAQLIQLLKENYNIESVADINDALKDLFSDTLQEMMNKEFDHHMGYPKSDNQAEKDNYRNGSYSKTVKTKNGLVELSIPRDRNADFEPVIVPKHQRDVSDIEDKIIALYGRGLSTRDISDEIKDLYGIEISATMVSNITEAVVPKIKEWQNRSLNPLYPIVFIDAVHFSVKHEARVVKKAAYVVLAYDLEGMKEILGIWIGDNESAKFWLNIFNELKTRGVKDILIMCSDNLSGIKEAVEAAYPKTIQQRCVVHMIRNSLKYVSYGDYRQFCKELKSVYQAVNETSALEALLELEDKWGKKYPSAIKVWHRNWAEIVPMFDYSSEIRRLMYTTNIIENLNRSLRKYTKTKALFPSDDSLMKSLYLSVQNVTAKWTMRIKNWDRLLNELEIVFTGRFNI